MSTRRLTTGSPGAALAWAGRGRNPALCARAAHTALKAYSVGEALPAADLLLTAGGVLLIDDTLLLLGGLFFLALLE